MKKFKIVEKNNHNNVMASRFDTKELAQSHIDSGYIARWSGRIASYIVLEYTVMS